MNESLRLICLIHTDEAGKVIGHKHVRGSYSLVQLIQRNARAGRYATSNGVCWADPRVVLWPTLDCVPIPLAVSSHFRPAVGGGVLFSP